MNSLDISGARDMARSSAGLAVRNRLLAPLRNEDVVYGFEVHFNCDLGSDPLLQEKPNASTSGLQLLEWISFL